MPETKECEAFKLIVAILWIDTAQWVWLNRRLLILLLANFFLTYYAHVHIFGGIWYFICYYHHHTAG